MKEFLHRADHDPTVMAAFREGRQAEISEFFYQWWFRDHDDAWLFNVMQKYLNVDIYHKYDENSRVAEQAIVDLLYPHQILYPHEED